jgi:hypothetical protein
MIKYQEGLLSVLAERARFIEDVCRDQQVVDNKRLESYNSNVLRFHPRILLEEVVRGLAETMPEVSLGYNLINNPEDTEIFSGVPIRKVINRARKISNALFHDFKFDLGVGVQRTLFEAQEVLTCYLNDVNLQNHLVYENEHEHLESDIVHFDYLRNIVQDLVGSLMQEEYELPEFSDPKYVGELPERVLKLIANAGKIPLGLGFLKRRSLNLLDRLIFPNPEYDFATENDSWTLFRQTYMGNKIMNFGFIKRNGNYELFVIDHKDTNALERVTAIKEERIKPFVAMTLSEALEYFTELSRNNGDKTKLNVYRVDKEEFEMNKSDWYRDLLERFQVVTTIKSMHQDQSLLFTRGYLPRNKEPLRQNIKWSNVNRKLRKIVNCGRILSGYEEDLKDSYKTTIPIISEYQREVFEMHLGVLVSDLSQVEQAKGLLFIPTYLFPSAYPSIGISRPDFKSVYHEDQNLEVAIAVRTTNTDSEEKVRQSVYDGFRTSSKIH